MCIVKVGEDVYINVERVTFVQRTRNTVVVHFAVGAGENVRFTELKLQGQEAETFLRWLDANSERATT
jgi:hypothetical protein